MNRVMTLGIEVEVDEKGSITKLRQIDSAVEAVGKSSTGAGGAINSFSGAIGGMATKLVGSLVSLYAVQAAFRGLIGFAGDSVRAFTEEEAVIKRLSTTLSTVGVRYGDVSDSLQGTFSEIQRLTRFADDETMDVFQRLVQTTGSFEAAQKLLLPTLDLAAGKQMDVAAAAELAGKAGAGNVEMLSRYGIILSDATKEQIKNADAMGRAAIVAGLLNEKFGGQAAATLGTYSGQVAQLKNYFGDLQESIGGALLRSLGDTGESTKWLADKMAELTKAINNLDLRQLAGSFDELTRSMRDFIDVLTGSEATQALAFLTKLTIFKLSKDLELAAQIFKSLTWGGAVPDIDSLEEAGRAIAEQARLLEQIEEHRRAIAEHGNAASRILGARDIANHSAEIDRLAGRYMRLEKAIYDYQRGVFEAGEATDDAGAAAAAAGDDLDKTTGVVDSATDAFLLMGDAWKYFSEMYGDASTITVFQDVADYLGQATEEAQRFADILASGAPLMNAYGPQAAGNIRNVEDALRDASHYADLFADSMRSLLKDALESAFSGEDFGDVIEGVFEGLGEMGANAFANAFQQTIAEGGDWETFTGLLAGGHLDANGNLVPATRAEQGLAIAQGAGMIYQGYQQGGSGGIIQGAMGGAAIGANPALIAATGGWSVVIGAIVGGLAGYFGGNDEEPETRINVLPGGQVSALQTRGGQGISAEENEAFRREISNLYRTMFLGFREALQQFGDAGLFDLVGEMPGFRSGGEGFGWQGMSMSELGNWLGEVALPDLFQSQFGEAITTGLEGLGMTEEAISEFWDEIGQLGGDERLDAMTRFISTLRNINDLIEDSSWESLWEEARTDTVTAFIDQLGEIGGQLDLLSAGWDQMDLLSRASEVEQIGQLFEGVLDGVIQMLQTIDAMRTTISQSWDAFRESMTLADLEGNTEGLRQYYQDQIDYWMQQLGEADTLEEIQRAQDMLSRYMNALAGVVPLTEPMDIMGWGDTWGEYLSQIADQIEALAQARLDEIEDLVQEAYDALIAQLYAARDALADFGAMLDDLSGGGDEPPDPDNPMLKSGGGPEYLAPDITVIVNNYAPGLESTISAVVDQKMAALYAFMARRSTLPIE